MSELDITASIALPGDKGIYGFKIWAVVPANSSNGILINAIEKSDQVFVNQTKNLNGLASFTKSTMASTQGIVGIANYIRVQFNSLLYPDEAAARPFFDAWSRQFNTIRSAAQANPIAHKRRDAFGLDPGGDKKYAINEGGVIICMPDAAGPIYSNKDTRPLSGSRDNGRLPIYTPARVKELNSGFLYRQMPGVITAVASRPGGLVVVAFDEGNAFGDNNGAYAMEILILRGANSPAGTPQAATFQRLSNAPPANIGDLGLNH